MEEIVFSTLERAQKEIAGFSLPEPITTVVLYGADGAVLDSLNLVALVFILEEEMEKRAGVKVKITASDVLDPEENPFSSITALSRLVATKLSEAEGKR